MADTFDIEVATPERLVFREAATEAQIPCNFEPAVNVG